MKSRRLFPVYHFTQLWKLSSNFKRILCDSNTSQAETMFKLILLFIFASSICAALDEYYVSPHDNCTSVNCYSLSYYYGDPDTYFSDDTIFYFMEGIHVLDHEGLLIISEVSNLTLQGLGSFKQGYHETVMESTVYVQCRYKDAGVAIINSTSVSIIGITFVNCGGHLPDIITNEIEGNHYQWNAVGLALIEMQDVLLDKISIQNSTNFGLVAINTFSMTISHSSFAGSNLNNYSNCTLNSCVGGNALLVYKTTNECRAKFTVYSINVQYSNFSFGIDTGNIQYTSASGLSIFMDQMDHYGVNIELNSLVLFGNTAVNCANLCYRVVSGIWYSLKINNITSVYANEINPLPASIDNNLVYGGGVLVAIFRYNDQNHTACYDSNSILPIPEIFLQITGSQISHNHATYGAGIIIFCEIPIEYGSEQLILIESTDIRNNSGYGGAGLYYTQSNGLDYKLILTNVSIVESRHFHPHDIVAKDVESAVLIRRTLNMTFINVNISYNEIAGMLLLNAIVCFSGYRNTFNHNHASNGGGIKIYGDSRIFLLPPAHIVFIENKAINRGGAIYIHTIPYTKQPCFFSPYDPTLNTVPDINVTFIGNEASVAGSAIYGGSIENCYLFLPSTFTNDEVAVMGTEAYNYIFHFQEQEGLSVISSNPENFCFCVNSTPDCSIKSLNFSTLPGEQVNISFVSVGQGGGIAPGVIAIEEWDTLRSYRINKRLTSTEPACSQIQYTPNVNVSTSFPTVQLVDFFLLDNDEPEKFRVEFHIKKCPLGFTLSTESLKCDCANEVLGVANITCNPMTESFYHTGNMWLGYINDSECFVAYPSCYYNYCKETHVNFTLSKPDEQCALNRSGILCGQCAEGLSLMLGANQCGECTNDYIALIIPFALAGIALVAFLIALNLTVSVGTINGLIFYANIVKINEDIFFQSGLTPLFASWINLDFGIQSCFYNGMTAYTKTWLQLLFPIYIWLLMIIIIILSRRFYKVSKLMGRHSISVLATLLLLSFTKIIRTCISAWQIAYISCEDREYAVWSLDASIMYWEPKHMGMFLLTLMLSVFIVAPYILILLFSPLIERYFSRYSCCKYWFKFKPLFDAYNGPYKDNYRFWTGLLLLTRFILAYVYAYNISNPLTTNIAVIICAATLLFIICVSKGVYQSRGNDFLECWFLVNVMFIAMGNLNRSVRIGVSLSISAAFFTFMTLVVYHLFKYTYFKKIPLYLKKRYYQRKRASSQKENANNFTNIDLLDNARVVTHTNDNNNSTEVTVLDLHSELQNNVTVYREGSVFVRMKRETLLREPNNDYVLHVDSCCHR